MNEATTAGAEADQLPTENLSNEFDIEHSTGSRSSSRSTGSDTQSTSTEKINFEPTELYLFGSDVDRHIVIEQVESGTEVRLSPTDEAGTYLVDRVRPETTDRDSKGELTVFTPEQTDVAKQMPVSIEGETEMFQQEVFATYRVRLMEGAEEMASTGGQVVGMRYEYSATQSGGEFRITRHPAVDEDWFARFSLGNDLQTTPVDHQDGDNHFVVDTGQFDVPSGQYGWSLELYPSIDTMEQRRGSRIIGLGGGDEIVVD